MTLQLIVCDAALALLPVQWEWWVCGGLDAIARLSRQAGGAWPVGNPQRAVAEEEAEMGAADQTEKQGWDARARPASSASLLDCKHFPLSSSGLETAGAGGQNPWAGLPWSPAGTLGSRLRCLRLAHLLK